MKFWLITLLISWTLGAGVQVRSAPAPELEITAAIQAIEQAADPSAAVAAYANGVAADRNSAAVHEAYVARMVDFGLPEMAYRQARTLTSMVVSNGLAWGVLAYVDARRGDMTNAVAAIDLAGRFAPEHPFVQRTAGEIIAWYDLQADRTQFSPQAIAGLEKIRNALKQRPTYIAAYDTARRAYQNPQATQNPQSQTTTPGPGQPQRPSLVETNPPQASMAPAPVPAPAVSPPVYYTEPYSYPYVPTAGPIWIEPDPYWWWRPVGFFSGAFFVPYTFVVVHKHRHGHDWWRDRGHHGAPGRFHRPSWTYLNPGVHAGGRASWHSRGEGRPGFFGQPAEPNPTVVQSQAPFPSWTYLNGTRQAMRPAPAPQPTVRTPAAPPAQSRTTIKAVPRSWSGFETLNQGPSYKSGAAAAPRATVPPRTAGPSWSTLSPAPGTSYRVAPPAAPAYSAPRMPAPSPPPPSWSALGRGGSTSSGSGRSSSKGSPSWSTLGSGSSRNR